jgi:serine-type D-Ala-D-Ala carboxypeptidase/endopeptidase (penicillin-binding protein 4)
MLNTVHRSLLLRCLIALVCVISLGGATTNTSTTTANPHKKAVVHHKSKKSKKKKIYCPAPLPANASLQQGIDQIVNSFNHNLKVGVMVESAANGATLYQHNAGEMFAPGSTLKLFTAASALSYLGPDYKFSTQFLAASAPQDGVLPGSLYVKFSGDPLLTVQDLAAMVRILHDDGIRVIRGNLIIDDLAMDRINTAPGWNPQDGLSCVNAPTTEAIILNRNCFGFNVIGSRQLNAPAQVAYGSDYGAISVINQVVTRHAHYAQCPFQVKAAAGSNTYVASGCLAPHRPIGFAVTLNDPRHAGTNILLNLLRQQDIAVTGGVGYANTPSNLQVLAEHDSEPLDKLITHMLKKSDNLIANTLFKKLGNVYFHTPGSWSSGVQAMRAILGARSGIDFSASTILDGCGLSHDDQVSPLQFVSLLDYAYHNLPSFEVFYNALPRSGIDGTLRFRLGGSTLDKVHAKTGTIAGASSLAGYVQTASHQTLVFAILINGSGNQGTYHMLEDRICKFLAMK